MRMIPILVGLFVPVARCNDLMSKSLAMGKLEVFQEDIGMWIWKEAREKWMLFGALTSFVLVILINLKLEVWSFLKGGKISNFLQADATGNVASDLFVGLCSTYVFYVFMELIPKYNREKESVAALNILLNSIFLNI